MSWETIGYRPAPRLETFLRDHEPSTTGLSDHYRRSSLDPRGRRGGRFLHLPDRAVLYQGPSGLFMPFAMDAVGPDLRERSQLKKRIGLFPRIRTVMGTEHDVQALDALLSPQVRDTVAYDLLYLPHHSFPSLLPPPLPELRIATPQPREWRALLQVQIAYEMEEVLLPGRTPVPAHSKAHLLDSLSNHLVLVALHRDQIIARVATNARGLRTDQIGGVFTLPEWRGRGVARWLMSHLLQRIGREKRDASLFVKQTNRTAQKLYRGMGFTFVSLYRISYYL
ncbi:MAG: GNAT family N-acetyltransferase [Spirochaetaceae bacterium]|nr:MAG: GNAT family N-acetyltransferase [Spirochaetaceae bacterium]